MSYWFAVAVSQRRVTEWERVFGTHHIPVLDPRPRQAWFREGPQLVYDVAVGSLLEGQLNRLAAHVARRNRVSYDEARSLVRRHGLTIRAEGVVIETTDACEGVGRFAFLRRVFNHATASAPSMYSSRL